MALAVLVPVAIVVWLVLGTGGSKSPTPAGASTTMASMKPHARMAQPLTAKIIAHDPQ